MASVRKRRAIMNAAEQIRLVKKAVKGDPDAYGRLITEHQEYLYKMAYLYVRNEETALDVVDRKSVV